VKEQGAVRRSLLCGVVASGVVDERVAYGDNGGGGDLTAWRDGAGVVWRSLLCGVVASGVVDERTYGGGGDLA
jgi:hypothetical protein